MNVFVICLAFSLLLLYCVFLLYTGNHAVLVTVYIYSHTCLRPGTQAGSMK